MFPLPNCKGKYKFYDKSLILDQKLIAFSNSRTRKAHSSWEIAGCLAKQDFQAFYGTLIIAAVQKDL
jgi:hypothetical protein